MLLLVMVLTTASAWAQDPQEPDLGYIVCDPANVIGGSLSLLSKFLPGNFSHAAVFLAFAINLALLAIGRTKKATS